MMNKRFENRLDKSNIKFNTQNPVWDNIKEDAFNVFEMIDMLNDLNDETTALSFLAEENDRQRRRYVDLCLKLKKQCIEFKEMLDDMNIAYMIDEEISELLEHG